MSPMARMRASAARLALVGVLALLACTSAVGLEVEFAACSSADASAELEVDLTAPYFRFQSLDASALAELTYPSETSPGALERILHPQPLLASSLEKVDQPGREYTEAEARALWDKHLHRFARNKHYTREENEERFAIFRKNLVKVSEQNWLHGGGFSPNAAFADLRPSEFQRMKGLLFKPQEIIREECTKLKKSAQKEREKAYRDWKAFKTMFGDTRRNPYPTPYNETARGRAKIARWRKIKALKAELAARKAAGKHVDPKRLAKLTAEQAAMRQQYLAHQAKRKAATAERLKANAVEKDEALKKQRSAEAARKAAVRREIRDAKRKAKQESALKAAGQQVKDQTPKAAGQPTSITPQTPLPVAAGGAAPAVVTPITSVAGTAPALVKVAGKGAQAAAAAAAPAKVLVELAADAGSVSLDADQLEEQSLAADQLDAEVAALSDMDASTEVVAGVSAEVQAEADAEADLGVDEEMVMLEMEAEIEAWMGAEAESESEEQQSIFARFESRASSQQPSTDGWVEAEEYVPPGELPVAPPSAMLPEDAPLEVRNAQVASTRGAWNFEFPGETQVFQPNAPTEEWPVPVTETPVAPDQPDAQPPSGDLPPAQPSLQPRVPANGTAGVNASVILSPAMDAAFKHTAATKKAANNKNIVDIDWRTKRVLTPPKSQGQCGSCWAQSAVTVVESMVAIRTNSTFPTPLSVQQVVSCDTQDSGCDGGNPITALGYLSNWGIANEAAYPYSPTMWAEGGPAPLCNASLVKDSFPYVEKAVVYQNDEVKIAQALMRGPLTALVDASRWQFYDGSKIVYPASGCGSEVSNLDHAVVIVGLGSLANGERYWIVRNHWDSTWGAGGYIFLAYGQNTCGIALQVTEAKLSEKAFLV